MASRRSRSPSTPSEGEIVESGSETKATTSQNSMNDTIVNRRTRLSPSYSPRSSSSGGTRRRSRSRSRTRTRSPYRRGEKRRRYDDYDDERYYRHSSHRHHRYGSRTSDYDRRYDGRRRRAYHDYDRDYGFSGGLRYTDDYERRDKRQRTRSRSRSPIRDTRKPKKYEDSDVKESPKVVTSEEQSVSERGKSPVVAQNDKPEAEREHQVQASRSSDDQKMHEPVADNQIPEEPEEPMDETARLEARRKRREAIKAKYRAQNDLRIQALHQGVNSQQTSGTPLSASDSPMSPAVETSADTPGVEFTVTKDEDLANGNQPMEGVEKDEPSAADYDPTQDMREERQRHDKRHFDEDVSATAYDETKATTQDVLIPDAQLTAPAKDPYDMFAEDDDDMFAPEPEGKPAHASAQAIPKPQELDMTMLDNWDDPEGYYNVRLGELINGRYHVHQNLGKGMFSSVVRASDSKTGKHVAIKIIRQNDTMRKAGLKEIQILEQLLAADPEDKKHIIRFERHFDHKGHLCMVFENLSMNLREVLKKFGRDVGLNLRATRAYAHQMFLGLSLLRKCNILHADLKPDNLLVNEQRSVLKICDLGSASPASENEITPYLVSRFYRAPEIILGIPYDYAIDMWSIGCTLYELYTGKILFTGRNNNQMLRSIMECRGKFPPKFLRKGSLTSMHFDDMLNFHSTEEDKLTGRVVTKVLDFKKPTRDLKSRLMGKGTRDMDESEAKELGLFVDLLDRCLSLNPEKRCTPVEALKHPFISRR